MNTKAIKNRNRYTGIDQSNWKVVTYEGQELTLIRTVITETGNKKEVVVTRWDGYKTANQVAQKLGGVAVRA